MNRFKSILREAVGLFVDDGSFALAIVIWLGFAGVVLPHLGIPAFANCAILFGGLAAILVESALRRSGLRLHRDSLRETHDRT